MVVNSTANPLASFQQVVAPIDGLLIAVLPSVPDNRGRLTVFERVGWTPTIPIQWNFVSSERHVLRGVHVHRDHTDWLVAVSGPLAVGLHDMRAASPTFGVSTVVVLEPPPGPVNALFIPAGVGHGFYSPEAGIQMYGTDTMWTPDDEFGCRWDDPELGIDWPLVSDEAPIQSERDRLGASLAELRAMGW